jgi:hypothetical protein
MWNLEERDGYFSRLKSTIEGLKYGTTNGTPYQMSLYFAIGNDKARRPSLPHTQWVAQYVLLSVVVVTVLSAVLLGNVGKV